MATNDTRMNQYLDIIATGIYGKDIRAAIHDGMEMTFNHAVEEVFELNKMARQAYETSVYCSEQVVLFNDRLSVAEVHIDDLLAKYVYLDARVDNIIVNGNPTEGNTELIDIRVDYTGVTYPTAGTAVRRQFESTNSRLDQVLKQTEEWSKVIVDVRSAREVNWIWKNPTTHSPVEGGIPTIVVPYGKDSDGATFHYDISTRSLSFIVSYLPDYEQQPTTVHHAKINAPLFSNKNASDVMTLIQETIINEIGETLNVMRPVIVRLDGTIEFLDAYLCKDNLNFNMNAEDSILDIFNYPSEYITENKYLVPLDMYVEETHANIEVNTPKDAEVIDARVGYDNITYQTIGEAIRAQIADLQRQIDELKSS